MSPANYIAHGELHQHVLSPGVGERLRRRHQGILYHDNGQANEGRAFVYYGNGGDGLDLLPRQLRTDGSSTGLTIGSAPIAPLGMSDSATAVQLRLTGRMPLGREDVKLEWQVAPLGTPFTASTVVSGTSATWTDVLTTGVVVTQNMTGLLTPGTPYHTRVITYTYDPLSRLTGADHRSTGFPRLRFPQLRSGQAGQARQAPPASGSSTPLRSLRDRHLSTAQQL